MKDVFNKSCMSQGSTRNSTMKISQPLKENHLWSNCISFLAPSVWNNLLNELKRCTNINMFKHKIKEYFFCKKDRKITISISMTRLLSSQQLMHFFSNFSCCFNYFNTCQKPCSHCLFCCLVSMAKWMIAPHLTCCFA